MKLLQVKIVAASLTTGYCRFCACAKCGPHFVFIVFVPRLFICIARCFMVTRVEMADSEESQPSSSSSNPVTASKKQQLRRENLYFAKSDAMKSASLQLSMKQCVNYVNTILAENHSYRPKQTRETLACKLLLAIFVN